MLLCRVSRIDTHTKLQIPYGRFRFWDSGMIVAGVTDMRRSFLGLSGMVQTALEQNPFSGHVFRGKRSYLIKVLWWNCDGLRLLAKRLERRRFVWCRQRSGHFRSRQRSYRCCWKSSTGGGRSPQMVV